VIAEQKVFRDRAREYENSPDLVRSIMDEGCDRARVQARDTLQEVRRVMGLEYRR